MRLDLGKRAGQYAVIGLLKASEKSCEVAIETVDADSIAEDGRVGAAGEVDASEALVDPEKLGKGRSHRPTASTAAIYQRLIDVEEEELSQCCSARSSLGRPGLLLPNDAHHSSAHVNQQGGPYPGLQDLLPVEAQPLT